MRKVNRNHIDAPVELAKSTCINHLALVVNNPKTDIRSDLYRGRKYLSGGQYEYTVVTALKSLYRYKCAYCEKSTYNPKIDHHRPTGKVAGSSDENMGYYWLAYEWTNLLPSCINCNDSAVKGSKYPVNGNRNDVHPKIIGTDDLDTSKLIYDCIFNTNEQPCLLHPEYCEPELHFTFDRSGVISGSTEEGRCTISTLYLDSPDLNGWRKSIYESLYNDLNEKIYFYFATAISDNAFNQLILTWTSKLVNESSNEDLDYTLFRSDLLKRIEYYFIDPLDSVFQEFTKASIILALQTLSQ